MNILRVAHVTSNYYHRIAKIFDDFENVYGSFKTFNTSVSLFKYLYRVLIFY